MSLAIHANGKEIKLNLIHSMDERGECWHCIETLEPTTNNFNESETSIFPIEMKFNFPDSERLLSETSGDGNEFILKESWVMKEESSFTTFCRVELFGRKALDGNFVLNIKVRFPLQAILAPNNDPIIEPSNEDVQKLIELPERVMNWKGSEYSRKIYKIIH